MDGGPFCGDGGDWKRNTIWKGNMELSLDHVKFEGPVGHPSRAAA